MRKHRLLFALLVCVLAAESTTVPKKCKKYAQKVDSLEIKNHKLKKRVKELEVQIKRLKESKQPPHMFDEERCSTLHILRQAVHSMDVKTWLNVKRRSAIKACKQFLRPFFSDVDTSSATFIVDLQLLLVGTTLVWVLLPMLWGLLNALLISPMAQALKLFLWVVCCCNCCGTRQRHKWPAQAAGSRDAFGGGARLGGTMGLGRSWQ
jgi:hypothetical protein